MSLTALFGQSLTQYLTTECGSLSHLHIEVRIVRFDEDVTEDPEVIALLEPDDALVVSCT